jgi:glycosyltransferase involved in cell wall biosynthesis
VTRPSVQFVGLSGYEYPHTRVRCYHFARELERRGYAPRVFSFHDRFKRNLPEAEMYGLPDRDRVSLVIQGAFRLARRSTDVLYIQKIHYHAAAALLASRFAGCPYVLDYDDFETGHDPYGVPLFCGFRSRALTTLFMGAAEPEDILRMVARRALFCVAASHFLMAELQRWSERVVYVPTGVDTSIFRPAMRSRDGSVILLWNGVVWGETIRDNVLFLLEALREMKRETSGVVLRIVGQGPFLKDIRQAVSPMGLDGAVEFRGWKSPDEMPRELREADIGLLPLLHDDPWTRGKSPTKLFEYMASGLAVVAFERGEAAHVLAHGTNGLVAPDKRQFVEQLRMVVTSPSLREHLGTGARREAERSYSLPVLGDRLAMALSQYGFPGARTDGTGHS